MILFLLNLNNVVILDIYLGSKIGIFLNVKFVRKYFMLLFFYDTKHKES